MRLFPAVFLFIACALCSQQTTLARQAHPSWVDNTRFTVWGGHSFSSMRFLGKTPDSQTSILGIGMRYKLRDFDNGDALFYTADIIPYVEYHYPKRDENNRRTTRTGWGLSPVGYQYVAATNHWLFPYVQTTGGFMYMNNEFPTDRARRLNFTFDITIGAHFAISARNTITLGYKFHHISNGQTGIENPGLDSNFLFVLFSI